MLVLFLSRSWAHGSSFCQSRAETPRGAAAVPTDLYPVEGLGTGGIEGTVEGGWPGTNWSLCRVSLHPLPWFQ